MNYDHAFHAGNAADVLKHAVLALLLDRLRQKPTPFFVLDSHAGAGRHDLGGEAAQRSGEAAAGILRLWPKRGDFPELATWLDTIAGLNPPPDGEAGELAPTLYPGSPLLAAAALRPDDRLVLVEGAEAPSIALRRLFGRDRRVALHRRDAWEALGALLPPRPPLPRRGLVLIDPAFEAAEEFARLGEAVVTAARRWPGGMIMAWYPVKEGNQVRDFMVDLAASGLTAVLRVEMMFRAVSRDGWQGAGLAGCGLILVRPPWQLDSQIAALLPRLGKAMGLPVGGGCVEWLVPEGPAETD